MVQSGITLDGIAWAFTTGYGANWHPLTWISHMVDCQLFSLDPAAHHLMNVLFHTFSTVLLFGIFHRMTGALWKSAFIAAVFALHPLHVESVAWAAERKDVLSTFFWALTIGMYVWYAGEPTVKKYLLMVLTFGLGLLSKPMLVTLPFVLLLLDYWPLNRIQLWQSTEDFQSTSSTIFRLVREKIPLFVMAIASSSVTYIVQRQGGAVRSFDVLPLSIRIENAFLSYLQYLEKSFWPSGLAVFYPHPIHTMSVIGVGFSCVVLLSITLLSVRTSRKLPYVIVGWLWYIGTLVPVIGIVQVGSSAMADRYMYVPLIGISIIVAWGVSDLFKNWQHKGIVLSAASTVALVGFGFCSHRQIGYWHDTISLFEHAQTVTQNNYIAHSNLALALTKQGKINEAMEHFKESLRINPGSGEMQSNMGSALIRQGRIAEAIACCEEAVHIRPDHPLAQYNLAYCLAAQGNISEAINHYAEAVRLKPDYADARLNLANLLAQSGNLAEAKTQFSELLRIDPRAEKAYLALGYYVDADGHPEEAIGYYTKALEIKPEFAEAHYLLGLTLARRGEVPDAIRHLREAVRIKPDYAAARASLEHELQLQNPEGTAKKTH